MLDQLISIQMLANQGPSDLSILKSKLSYVISNLQISSDNTRLSRRVITDNLLDTYSTLDNRLGPISDINSVYDDLHSQTEHTRSEIMVMPIDTQDELARQSRLKNRVDPMHMRPAGVKSDAEQVYRHDSVQYLDNKNKNKYADTRYSADQNKQHMMQSGRITDIVHGYGSNEMRFDGASKHDTVDFSGTR